MPSLPWVANLSVRREDDLTPLLLLVLAGLWAAVLIPATRGGRDAAYDGRSIQGFHTAMRVLSRRTKPADGRYIMVPTPEVTGGPPIGGRRQQQRRRRMLIRLMWAAGLSLVAAVFLRGPWPVLHLVADGLLIGYAVRLRRLARVRTAVLRAARRAELERREAAHRAEYEAAHPKPPVVLPEDGTYVSEYRAGEQRRAANA